MEIEHFYSLICFHLVKEMLESHVQVINASAVFIKYVVPAFLCQNKS